MTPENTRKIVEEELLKVAPDAELAILAPDADLREALDLDSMDFQNFVANLSHRIGSRIEEDEYGQLSTLDQCVSFLAKDKS